MDAGRTVVEQSTIGNRIVTRVAAEINASLGPTVPASVLSGTNSTASSSAGSTTPAAVTTTNPSAIVVFQVCVKGHATSVSVITTPLTRSVVAPQTDSSTTLPVVIDMPRLTCF